MGKESWREESWGRNLKGGIIGKESRGGIMGEESRDRNHRGGIMEESWLPGFWASWLLAA